MNDLLTIVGVATLTVAFLALWLPALAKAKVERNATKKEEERSR